MIVIRINNIIDQFALDTIIDAVENNPDEKEFRLDIHSDGGEIESGLAIYDYIRTSDKTFYTNIIGNCHSIAVVILLAAKLENRSANPNARALIHNVLGMMKGNFSPEELQVASDELISERQKIANIYADRTQLTSEEALQYMLEEEERDIDWLLEKGFISKVNGYKNSKIKTNIKMKNLFLKIMNLVNEATFDVLDEDGNVIFTTEKAEFEVGDEATPDGEFELVRDGKKVKVTIAEGKIAEIEEETETETIEPEPEEIIEPANVEPEPEPETETEPEAEPVDEEKEALKKEIEDLKAQIEEKESMIEELQAALKESLDSMRELKSQIKSNYTPATRMVNEKQREAVSNYKDEFNRIFKH